MSTLAPDDLDLDGFFQGNTYTTCDISDILLTLSPAPHFLPDLHPLGPHISTEHDSRIALASTVTFGPLTHPSPLAGHYADLALLPSRDPYGRILVISSPGPTSAALLGGTVARRLVKRGARGAIVDGRVRDTAELSANEDFCVWADGRSCVGAGQAGKVVAVGETVNVRGVYISQGDLVVADAEGVVIVPQGLAEEVGRRLERWLKGEEKVGQLVEQGVPMVEAVKAARVKVWE